MTSLWIALSGDGDPKEQPSHLASSDLTHSAHLEPYLP